MPKIVPKSERGSLLGARDFSDAHDDAQATEQGFFTSSSNRCQTLACARGFLAERTPPGHLSGGRQSWPLGGGFSDGLIFDQRLFWVLCLMLLIVKGAGKFSLDYLLGIEKDSRQQG